MANGLTKKAGPLPVWAWGILGGIAVYFLYTRYQASSANAATTSPVATALDPNAVDPTTGLTYGQELAGSSPAAGGLQGSADTSSSTPSLDSQLQDLGSLLGDFGLVAGQLGFTPPQPSSTSTDAAASPPLDNSTPVATEGAAPGVTAGQVKQIVAKALKGKTVQTKNPTAHRAKTIHAANPAPHQHKVTAPKSKAKPQPIKHPAGGGNPGRVQSGSHAKPTTAPARTGHPVARNPAPARRPPAPPKPKPTRRRGP